LANNLNYTDPVAGTVVVASDDIASVHYQYVKIAFGPDDTATLVTASVGLPVSDAGGSLTIDAPVGTPAFVRLSDGSAAITTLPVSLASVPSHPVTNAGTFAVQSAVSGDTAHDAADAGAPVKVGMRALAHGTNPTAVAAADRTDWLANRHGVPWVMCGHPAIVTSRTQFTAAQTDASLVGTIAAGTKVVLTSIMVSLDNASTVFPSIRIGFGATNTPTGTGVVAAHGGLPAGGGFARGSGAAILGVGGDGEELRVTTVGAATGNGVEIVITYFLIES
jgi:hypothetical protein